MIKLTSHMEIRVPNTKETSEALKGNVGECRLFEVTSSLLMPVRTAKEIYSADS